MIHGTVLHALPWLMSTLGLVAPMLIGRKIRFGWLIAIVNCLIAICYNISTTQWGFLLCLVPLVFINAKNYVRWGQAEEEKQD
jgi:hypothetical protein